MIKKQSRRQFLRGAGLAALGAAVTACTPGTVTTIEKTVEVEVEKIIRETSVVKENVEVTKVVEVTAVPRTGPTNALGVVLPADAAPLEQQIGTIVIPPTGDQMSGAFGHEMESLYNRAYPLGYGSEVLTQLDNEGKVVGIGAESWKQSEDGLTWDFKLREGLQFSDGTPLTANDWVWTFQRSFKNNYDFGWYYSDIVNTNDVLAGTTDPSELGIEAVDDFTLRFTTTAPTPYIPAVMTVAYVAPKQAYEKGGDSWSLDPATYISSGPWILTEFERGVRWTWELNTAYKGVNRPYLTRLEGKVLTSSLPAYINGEIMNYALTIDSPAGEVGIVNSNPILRAESHPGPANVTWYIGFNTLNEDFKELQDRRVRLALNKAIDKETIIGEISRGFAVPAWGILPKGFPGSKYDELKNEDPNVFDVEAAKALLAEAGFPEGKGFPKFELWIRNPRPYMVTVCEAVQAAWKANLGIDVQLAPKDHQTFTQATFKDRTVPIYFVGYSLDYFDPATFLAVFRKGSRHPHEDAAYDEVYEKSNALIDPEARLAGLAEAEKQLVNDAGYIFLIQPISVNLWPCNLSGENTVPNSAGYAYFQASPYFAGNTAWTGVYWTDSTCREGLS